MRRSILVAVVALLALPNLAMAGTLFTPPLLKDSAESFTCSVLNVSDTLQEGVVTIDIFCGNSGTPVQTINTSFVNTGGASITSYSGGITLCACRATGSWITSRKARVMLCRTTTPGSGCISAVSAP